MAGRHDQRGSDPEQVEVSQLIARVAQEGRPVRLSWSDRIVSDSADVEEWPTGELLRVALDEGASSARGRPATSIATEPSAPPDWFESDELWGNRGPRPYQNSHPCQCPRQRKGTEHERPNGGRSAL